MLEEAWRKIDPERLIVMYDSINISAYYENGRLVVDPPDGKLNMWAVCAEDYNGGFRGYGGRFWAIQHPDGDIIVTTNLWHLGEVRKEVDINTSIISVCLTDLKWQASKNKKIDVDTMKAFSWKSFYTDGWKILEKTDVSKLLQNSFRHLEVSELLAKGE